MFDEYPDVLNVSQLSQALAIGKNNAYELLRKGEINAIKVGCKYIIPKIYIMDYIEQNRKSTSNEHRNVI